MRVDRKNPWIHVYSAGDITLQFLYPKRGRAAVAAINILPRCALKRRPKPFTLLAEPRASTKERMRAHGHPKKQR